MWHIYSLAVRAIASFQVFAKGRTVVRSALGLIRNYISQIVLYYGKVPL